MPEDGAVAIIPKGRTIYLRGETAKLASLIIQGVLIFDDVPGGATVHANHIFIQVFTVFFFLCRQSHQEGFLDYSNITQKRGVYVHYND